MKLAYAAAVGAAVLMAGSAQAAVDVVQAPTGYFVPTDAQKYDSPYMRGNGQDWGWTHGGIATGFATADLNISAFDVDAAQGENDQIWALDSGTWTLLGSLAGANDTWAFTTFNLGSNFFDDIVAGLQVKIVIDTTRQGWVVTLAKSTLTTDGAGPGNPNPGVPEPATWAMLIAGFGMVGATMRRRRRSDVHA